MVIHMDKYSENITQDLRNRHDRYIKDFVDGVDSEDVLRARLFGLGFRTSALKAEMDMAKQLRFEKHKPPAPVSNKNWNCDNTKCSNPKGEVRLFKLGGSNLILCRSCWAHENSYRASRGGERSGFPLQNWDTAEVYQCSGA